MTTVPTRRWPRFAPLCILLVAALAVRVALTPLYAYLPGGFSDEAFWKVWMQYSHQHGVLNIFHARFVNYVGYQWVLWLLSMVYAVIGGPYTQTTPSLHILVKMPSIVFDMALIAVVYTATEALAAERQLGNARRLALIGAAVIAFQPAVLYDGAIWAQTDSAVVCAMLASIYLASRGRPGLAWAALALGLLVKPHPVIVLPVVAVLTLRASGWRGLTAGVFVGVAVFVGLLAPWLLHGDGSRIVTIYKDLFRGDYGFGQPRLSASAWNIWWFKDVGHHARPSDTLVAGLSYTTVGRVLSAGAGLLALAYIATRTRLHDALIAAAYLAFAFYMLPISTHERYLFPFLALLLPVVVVERRWLLLYVPVSATFFLNLIIVAPPVLSWSNRWYDSKFTLAMAGVNIALFAAFTAWMAASSAAQLPELRRRLFERVRAAERGATPRAA